MRNIELLVDRCYLQDDSLVPQVCERREPEFVDHHARCRAPQMEFYFFVIECWRYLMFTEIAGECRLRSLAPGGDFPPAGVTTNAIRASKVR